MNFVKRLYWNTEQKTVKGKRFAHVHLLVGYNQGTLKDFQIMAIEIRKTFPFVKDDDLQCTHVIKSNWCDGFTLMHFNMMIDVRDYSVNGWDEGVSDQMTYYFS